MIDQDDGEEEERESEGFTWIGCYVVKKGNERQVNLEDIQMGIFQ